MKLFVLATPHILLTIYKDFSSRRRPISMKNVGTWFLCIICKSAGNTWLGGTVNTLLDKAAIWSHPDRLEKRAEGNLREYNKGKWKAPCLGWNKPIRQDKLGKNLLHTNWLCRKSPESPNAQLQHEYTSASAVHPWSTQRWALLVRA